jgi:pyruvate dehydrogenase E1 component alpha subunit
MSFEKDALKSMYVSMKKIREFETKAATLFAEGEIPGFVHLYVGEEAVATGISENLRKDDYITSHHRGHGHIIAKGGDLNKMMAELFGKEDGYCKGKGGSMHIADAERGILGANGIVGAGHNIAAGAGLSIKYRETDQVSICFFGDGSTNQGTFHESMNLAAIWKLPVVFVCENNGYGISMSQERHQAIKDIADRGAGYGVPSVVVDGNDILAVYEAGKEAIERARKGLGPTLIEAKTYRHRGHFEGDATIYRTKEEVNEWLKKDPIPRFVEFLLENGFTKDEIAAIDAEVVKAVDEAVVFARNSPLPAVEKTVEDVYTDIVEEVRVR